MNHPVGNRHLLLRRKLRRDALLELERAQAIAAGDTRPLRGLGRRHHDNAVHGFVKAAFDQQRRFVDHDRHAASARLADAPQALRADARMYQRLEPPARGRVGEHPRAQGLPVDGPIRGQNVPSEGSQDLLVGRLARPDHVPSDLVGVDQLSPELAEHGGNRRLSAADAAGQADHERAPHAPNWLSCDWVSGKERTSMEVISAEFEAFATDPAGWPPAGLPEIAFAGRSNVGKSSLVNLLASRRNLARTSSTPGRTRGLVFFRIEPAPGPPLRFVDLPGYGWARVARGERLGWRRLVEAYVERRDTLALVLVVIDARRGGEVEERDLLEWLAALGRPARVVATKIDQIPRTRRAAVVANLRRELGLVVTPIGFSAREGLGRDALWQTIRAAAQGSSD